MSNNAEPQCPKCQHNMRNTSCGACVDLGMKKTKDMMNLVSKEFININKKEELKFTCKVVMNNPEDFDKINPYNCQYFLSNAFKFF